MDCGVVVDEAESTARCVPMIDVKRGMPIVAGHAGVRVFPQERGEVRPHDFAFMSSGVSTEKPKGALIREIARELVANKRQRRQDAAGRRAGDRPHRQRAAACAS